MVVGSVAGAMGWLWWLLVIALAAVFGVGFYGVGAVDGVIRWCTVQRG